jgi:hypothetical protein
MCIVSVLIKGLLESTDLSVLVGKAEQTAMCDLLLAGRGEILLRDPVSKTIVKFIALKWSDSVHALHS